MLRKYRNRIDEIDNEIVNLLKDRFEISREIGRVKQVNCLEVQDDDREVEKYERYRSLLGEDSSKDHVMKIMEKVIAESRDYQDTSMYTYGLLGRNLSHSLSPEVHKLVGEYEYGLFEREPEDLEKFLKEGKFKGINITIPYKKDVMEYCDRLSNMAISCCSVNTIIKKDDGTLLGDNTDYYGLRYLMVSAGFHINGAKCIILGNGGVSSTVRQVLSDMDAGEIVTISRDGENNYLNIVKHFDAEYIFNATPVGMFPNSGSSLIDISSFKKAKGVIDLIYNPLRTRLVLDAQKLGIKAMGGLEMLVAQAAVACWRFTGKETTYEEIGEKCDILEKSIENIILIGMPGCGKTSIGRKLASITGKKFIDTDEMIEEEYDKLCEEIILIDGEEKFRAIERNAVLKALENKGVIIAAGGGVVEESGFEYPFKENGKVVYIRRNLKELETERRPLSQSVGTYTLYQNRKEAYESWSDLQVDNEGVYETAIMIAALLGYIKKEDDSI